MNKVSALALERISLYVLVALAFFLRVWDLGRSSLWYDEILQAQIARGALAEIFPQLVLHAAMPLDYFIERLLLALGTNEFLLRFPAAAFSTLAVVVLYRIGRLMFGRAVGIISAAFLAASSFAVLYAHEARPYSLYLLLTLASFYWLYRALQTNRLAHWLWFGVCITGAVLTHLFGLFILVAQLTFITSGLIVRAISPRRAKLFSHLSYRTLASAALAAVLFFIAFSLTPNAQFVWGSALRFFGFLLAPNFSAPDQTFGLAPGETIPAFSLDFLYSRIAENLSGGGLVATTTFIALGAIGISNLSKKFWTTLLVIVWALLPAALILLFLFYRATLFAARYLIAGLPAWLLLCALGVIALGSWIPRERALMHRAFIAALTLAFLFIMTDRAVSAIAVLKEEWRTAGKILDLNVRAGDAVLTPGGTRVVYFYAPNAESFADDAELAPQIADTENHFARVWLVMNRYVFDPSAEISAWLQGRGAVEIRADDDIRVYYWRVGADTAALLDDAKNFQLPASSPAYASLAEQFAFEGDLPNAETYFKRALDVATLPSETANVNAAWGDALRQADALDSASQKYRAALAADPNQVTAWIGLGRVYLDQAQFAAAQDCFQHALALDSQSYAALFFLANAYEQSGDPVRAQDYYTRAAQLIPELPTPP